MSAYGKRHNLRFLRTSLGQRLAAINFTQQASSSHETMSEELSSTEGLWASQVMRAFFGFRIFCIHERGSNSSNNAPAWKFSFWFPSLQNLIAMAAEEAQ